MTDSETEKADALREKRTPDQHLKRAFLNEGQPRQKAEADLAKGEQQHSDEGFCSQDGDDIQFHALQASRVLTPPAEENSRRTLAATGHDQARNAPAAMAKQDEITAPPK